MTRDEYLLRLTRVSEPGDFYRYNSGDAQMLAWLLEHLGRGRPRSLRTVALLDKPSGRTVDAPVDYVGFTMPNRFVVGYGLDHDEQLRHLPYIAALDLPAVTAGGEVEQ